MGLIEVTLPRMLAHLVKGPRVVTVEAQTAFDAIDAVVAEHPELRVHIYDEAGRVRPNVACFHNGTAFTEDRALLPGDRVTILQAVSGG